MSAENRIEIIAEIANAHQGEPEQALALARAAARAGADAVKFQIYSAPELLVKAHPRYGHFRNQAFSPQTWRELLAEAETLGPRVCCDVFGPDSLELALSCGVTALKAHSSDLGNLPLLERMAETADRVYLSAGGATMREIRTALGLFAGSRASVVLLHGFQSYPTAVEDSRLGRIARLREQFGAACEYGYMDHVDGADPLAMALPLAAIGLGATVIEKHLTLDRSAKGVDYYSSLEPDEFARFVTLARGARTAMAGAPWTFSDSEREYRRQVKKHWVAARPLAKGHVLEQGDLAMKRVAEAGFEPARLNALLGRELLADLAEEQPLRRADVRHFVWALPVARSKSSRLPGKALLDVAGTPALGHLFERLKQARSIDRIVFCTTKNPEDDALADLAEAHGLDCHRGQEHDVLARMLGAIEGTDADVVLRVTGDDILVDPEYVDRAVAHHLAVNAEYTDLKALPSGTEVEVFDAGLLRDIHSLCRDSGGTEYLTFYVTHHPDQFATASAPVDEAHRRDWRLTMDTAEDFEVIRSLLEAMRERGKALTYRLDDLVDFFAAHPEVLEINAGVRQRQAPPEVCTDMDWGGRGNES